jgi:hypothetical protein
MPQFLKRVAPMLAGTGAESLVDVIREEFVRSLAKPVAKPSPEAAKGVMDLIREAIVSNMGEQPGAVIGGGIGMMGGLAGIAAGKPRGVAELAPSIQALIPMGMDIIKQGLSGVVDVFKGDLFKPRYLEVQVADKESMTKKIQQSLREGISPLEKFAYEMKVVRGAFPGEGAGDVRQRVRGEALLVQDLISKRTKEMRDDLPRAAMQDSAEALDMINKSQIMVPDTLEGIKTVLEGMGEETTEMNRHMASLERIMERIERKEPGLLERLNIK